MPNPEERANRLINEKNPYLLQHAYNPVDWYPWCDKAFERAKAEDKPIFVSIGYSTCHWCHVMEKESFEDEEIAEMMNETFVNIKVDKEERPDIDGLYMSVCQMMTGGSGWPLTIVMTPDKKPFFASTYIPKESKFGRIGMKELIRKIRHLWKNQRSEIDKISEKVISALREDRFERQRIDEQDLHHAFESLKENFDEINGGFGHLPKFPTPQNLLFLLRYWKKTGKKLAIEMVEKTLLRMRLGGIFDHIGYGFHRYSTDSGWLLPHFEKMLYDQAMLIIAYAETYQATKDTFYRWVAEEIVEYVLRDMRSEEGAFYSAEDADSEGEEGKFYLWTAEEIRQHTDDLFFRIFNIREDGNFKDESTGLLTGKNIIYMEKTIPDLSMELGIAEEDLRKQIEKNRLKLLSLREKRTGPSKDDKILADWNGLMVAALAVASRVFGKKEYLAAAEKAAKFILKNMVIEDRLYHRYSKGEVAVPGFLDDYAFFVWGLLEIYQTGFETRYLRNAIKLTEKMVEIFKDEEGGFFFNEGSDDVIVRRKEIYDGAYFSGYSVAVLNLIKISRITGRDAFEKIAVKAIESVSGIISRIPAAFTGLLIALDFLLASYEIVIAGDFNLEDTKAMIQALNREFIPNKVVILKSGNEIDELSNFTVNLAPVEGKATVYVCKNFQCNLPVTDVLKMMELLSS